MEPEVTEDMRKPLKDGQRRSESPKLESQALYSEISSKYRKNGSALVFKASSRATNLCL